jgi:hypothetical protein
MLRRLGFIVPLFLMLLSNKSFAQTDTLFWFAAPDLLQPHGDRPIFLRVAAGTESAIVSISQPADPSFPVISFFVPANQTISRDLTTLISRIENGITNTIEKKALLIRSDKPINCYYDIAGASNGDLYSLKGANALGTAFTVPFQVDLNTTNRIPATFTADIIILANQSVSVHSSLGLLLMDQFTKTSSFISGDFAFEFEMDVAVLSKRNKIAYLINIYFGDKKGLGITPTPHILKQTHFK